MASPSPQEVLANYNPPRLVTVTVLDQFPDCAFVTTTAAWAMIVTIWATHVCHASNYSGQAHLHQTRCRIEFP